MASGMPSTSVREAVVERAGPSFAVTLTLFGPRTVPAMVAVDEKDPPPLAVNGWVLLPPTDDRSPVTVVLPDPLETETVNVIVSPAMRTVCDAETVALSVNKLLRGLGVPLVKSALLLSVSVAPKLLRRSAVVLVRTCAAAVPSNSVDEP